MLAADEVLVANKVLVANEVDGVESGDESIEKSIEPKTEKSSSPKKPPALKHAFTLLRLAFTKIWIETKFQSSLFSRKMIL